MMLSRTIRGVGALLVTLLSLAVLAPRVGAQANDPEVAEPRGAVAVTKVDAVGDTVELVVSGSIIDVEAADVSVSAGEEALAVSKVSSSQSLDRPTELVLIVDTNARSANEQLLERTKAQLIDEVSALSDSTAVAVISAGDSALVETKMTTDKARIVAAIEDLSSKNGSALFNAIDRAATLFSDEVGTIRTVAIISSGVDTSSDVTVDRAQVGIVQQGAQLISVRYDGGEGRLSKTVEATAGSEFSASPDDDYEAVLGEAIAVAADRLVVSFDGEAEVGTRTNLVLEVGGSSTDFSYPAGVFTDSPLQLAALPEQAGTGLSFFRTSAGLYIALGLAFIGITLGVWSLGSILAGSESNLDGMLSRYTDGSIDTIEGEEMDELIVQSAILQRAVTFSETFAEKRGFLARVEELLERANLPVRAGEAMFILVAIGLLSGGLGIVLTRSILAAILFGLGAAGIAFFVVRFLGRRRFKLFESQLPDTLQLLSGTLRAGYSLPQGFEVVSKEIADPMGQELRRAMTEARLGRELDECLAGVSDRMSSPDFAWAVMAIGIQREVGGNLNELLMSVADTMIARERLKREIGALTAEGKMSAGVLSFLPPGLGFVMWIMNPEYVGVLFTEFLGNVFLGLGTVSALIGLAWMKKVITVDV